MFREGSEEGQGLVEYALILILVAIVVIVILTILGPTISNLFVNIVNSVSEVAMLDVPAQHGAGMVQSMSNALASGYGVI